MNDLVDAVAAVQSSTVEDGAFIGAAVIVFVGRFIGEPTFRDLGSLWQLPGLAVQRLKAEGYGLGGETDWKTSALLATVKSAGAGRGTLPGGQYLPIWARPEDPRRPHDGGLPDDRHAEADVRDPPAGHRRPRGPGATRLRCRGGPRHRCRPGHLGNRFFRVTLMIDVIGTDEPFPQLPVAHAV